MTAPTEVGAAGPGFLAGAAPLDLARAPLPPPIRTGGRLTILDITKYFGETTGGIRSYLLAKARYVARRPELRQVLVVPGARDMVGESDGVRCYRVRGPAIPFDRSYRLLLSARTTGRLLEHERPDLVEVGSPWLVPWVTRRANRQLHAPLVWFYHTHFPAIIAPPGAGTPAWRRGAGAAAWGHVRRLARLFRAVLAASESVASELEREGVGPVRRVALGVDLGQFTPARRVALPEVRARHGLPDAPLAVYLGRFAEEKQLEVVLAAWREVGRRTGAWLALAGTGPREPRLRAMAEGAQVRWLPFLRHRDEVADLLAAADLYLAPGPAETFGLSALEALASGTPVLSVDRGGVADRVRASGIGALYPVGDAGACREQAVSLLALDRARVSREARAYAEAHHSLDAACDGIFAAYRDVLAGRG